jgi:hypothetical protein
MPVFQDSCLAGIGSVTIVTNIGPVNKIDGYYAPTSL